jgi:conjugative transfer region protein TrbK
MFRLAAVAFALLVILVASLQSRRPERTSPNARLATVPASAPVNAQLARCQAIGAAGAQDLDCLKAWEAARNRFLGVPKAGR